MNELPSFNGRESKTDVKGIHSCAQGHNSANVHLHASAQCFNVSVHVPGTLMGPYIKYF